MQSGIMSKSSQSDRQPERIVTVEEYDRDPRGAYVRAGAHGRVRVVDGRETVMIIDRRPLEDDE
jgi:hypothetical protein